VSSSGSLSCVICLWEQLNDVFHFGHQGKRLMAGISASFLRRQRGKIWRVIFPHG